MRSKPHGAILRAFLGALTIIGLTVAGYRFLDYEALMKAWNRFSWGSVTWLLLLPALYLAAKGCRFRELVRPVSSASTKPVFLGYVASQAASLLPGGVAMRAAMMHRVGVPVEKSSGPILANSGADQLFLLSAGLLLCYYYSELRTTAFILTTLLLLMIAALYFETSRTWLKERLLGLGSRFNQQQRMERMLDSLPYLADLSLFARTMAWTVAANTASIVALLLIVDSLGFKVEPWPLVAAFVVPNLLGRLSPLPAGVGVVEAGMVGFMTAQTSLTLNQAAVATVIFRVVDILLPAVYGGLCHLFFLPSEFDASQPKGAAA
jgi:uncharacterized protein (TIRG00374 family)